METVYLEVPLGRPLERARPHLELGRHLVLPHQRLPFLVLLGKLLVMQAFPVPIPVLALPIPAHQGQRRVVNLHQEAL